MGARLRAALIAAVVAAVAYPGVGVKAALPVTDAPVPIDMGEQHSWLVGLAATQDRLVIATGREVLLANLSGSVLLRRDFPGSIRGMAVTPDGADVYISRFDPPSIDRLDATTLLTKSSLTITDGSCPKAMVPAGGRLWLTLECTSRPIASVDGALTTQPQHLGLRHDTSMAASADGSRLFLSQPPAPGSDGPGLLSVVDASDPAATVLKAVPFPEGGGGPMAASPDGTSLVVGGRTLATYTPRVRVLDARTLEIRTTLQAFDPIDRLVVTGDSRRVVGLSNRRRAEREHNVLWWSIDRPGQVGSARPTEPDRRPQLAPSPDGRSVYALGDDGLLHRLRIGPDPT
ncbi:MAG: YncE family protein, partial [Actinomycetes bacterium]